MSRASFGNHLEILVANAEAEERLLEVYAAVVDLMAALPGHLVEGQATALANGALAEDQTPQGALSALSVSNFRPTMLRGRVILTDRSDVSYTDDGRPMLDFEAETYTEVTCWIDDDPSTLAVDVHSPEESTSAVLGARIGRILDRIPQPSAPPVLPPAGVPVPAGTPPEQDPKRGPGRLHRSARWLGRHVKGVMLAVAGGVLSGWILASCGPPWGT